MNENLNLVEILKDCPKGTKLYSPICGEVEFEEILSGVDLSIKTISKTYNLMLFYKNGQYLMGGECLLFPSKDQRDWSKFQPKKPKFDPKKPKFDPKTLQPFDKVLVRYNDTGRWRCAFYSHGSTIYKYTTANSGYIYCIPYNDDTKHLVGTNEEAPEFYRYWKD